MSLDRRSFFALLAASGAAIAEVPEVEKVETIEPEKDGAIIVTTRGGSRVIENLSTALRGAFPNGPLFLVVGPDITFQRLNVKRAKDGRISA